MVSSFEDLHDATLVHVDFTWGVGVVDLYLRTCSSPRFLLKITKVTAFDATRMFEWGPSAQVNSVTVSGELVVVEMQSGDTIRIKGHIDALMKQ